MQAPPTEHDPDWPRYPETVLKFAAEPPVVIDLRMVITPANQSRLEQIGLGVPFAVMTAFDPRGENLTPEQNDELSRKLDARLRGMGHDFIRVDACSPGGEHCECSVAVKMPKEGAVRLAAEFEQVALFWFDGSQFWIIGAMVPTDPMILPRSS